MKKRIIILLLCLYLFVSYTMTAVADGVPEIYGDKVECNSGDVVSYSVHIKNNPGMTAFLVGIGCESDWLYFEEDAKQGDFSDAGTITSSSDGRRTYAMWCNVDAVSDDGTLFTIDIAVSPSTPDGDYPIEIAYSDENTLDADCNEMELKTVEGCISVKHIQVDNSADTAKQNGVGPTTNKIVLIISAIAVTAVAAVAVVTIKKKHKKTEE